jgi:ubiquinone/menaquinone biosynthesis C-methylase UbiE
MGYFLINPLRRFMQNPRDILSPYVHDGMTVLEIGPGMGYFTLPLARMAGSRGRVVVVDIQEQMLAGLRQRASRAGLDHRIDCRLSRENSLGVSDVNGLVDFALAFAVVHEVPDQAALFRDLHAALKPGALLLMADPRSHWSREKYGTALAHAARAGFVINEEPAIWNSRTALLKKERYDHAA